MNQPLTARTGSFLGLGLVSLATLMFEILLTRIFSVTMWHHFAFVAVSLAMFGMTVGAVLVYLFPKYFAPERTRVHLALSALMFGLCALLSFHVHLLLRVSGDLTPATLPALIATYAVTSVPFVMSGICISLALTRFARQVSRLYATDLIAAAVGCLVLGFLLQVTDGPTAVYGVAALAMLGGAAFAFEAPRFKLVGISLGIAGALIAFMVVNASHLRKGHGLIQLTWTKLGIAEPALYERWNSYSRVQVVGDPNLPRRPKGWGFSPSMPDKWRTPWLNLAIDASADTPLTPFNGDLTPHEYLRWDVTNLVHSVHPNSDVLVVGSGGGRDLLSALVFGQKSVTGVEMNPAIVNAVTGPFADFTGHLDRNPKVHIINDEARSFLTRTTNRYDVIELSLIDTWAATAAGAFVMSENGLYTVDAWEMYLSRLRPGGIITVSRWFATDSPNETYRLAGMANAALRRFGASYPRRHIAVVINAPPEQLHGSNKGVATFLTSRDPLTDDEIDRLEETCRQRGFSILMTPRSSSDPTLAALAGAFDPAVTGAAAKVDLSPPTDDRPFFFHTWRLGDLFSIQGWRDSGGTSGIFLLAGLLGFVTLLSLACIVLPVWVKSRSQSGGDSRGLFPLTAYFASIGIGFMMIEVAQMQRLVVLLGHPAYSLTAVLFSLLVFSGLGSWSTASLAATNEADLRGPASRRLLGLLVTLGFMGIVTPALIRIFQGSTTPLRIGAAVVSLAPIGFFMGMAFPIGMKWAAGREGTHTAWLWAVNGAASVCASIFAVIISMTAGISAAWWMGTGVYGVATVIAWMGMAAGRVEEEARNSEAETFRRAA